MLAMGQYDAPQKQKQPIFELDPYKSHIAVFGTPMSGKTTFVKTLLVRLHENADQRPRENIYIIDFGGNIGRYGKLCNVCACFDNSNEENIKRVFRTIEARMDENAKKLDSQNYYSVIQKNPEDAPDHLFLIIENVNAFLSDERYSAYQDRLLKLCRDGLSKGLTVVITANEMTGLNRVLANFGQKVVFEMPADYYVEIFNTKVTPPLRLPGRGIVNIENVPYEFQCFLPFPTLEDEEYIQQMVEQTAQYPNPHIMAAFGEILNKKNFMEYCASGYSDQPDAGQVVVGLDYYEHKPVCVNYVENRSIAIYGKRKFGKSNLLTLLLQGIQQQHPDTQFVFFDDGREQLTQFVKPDSPRFISPNSILVSDLEGLLAQMAQKGHIAPGDGVSVAPKTDNAPFVVYVLQSKMLYRTSTGQAMALLRKAIPQLLSDAIGRNVLFIFSDVPNISDADTRRIFNDNIAVACLLDSIGDFLSDKMDKTPFGMMDPMELKLEYAKCALGDGYLYETEADKLKKLKFIKAD